MMRLPDSGPDPAVALRVRLRGVQSECYPLRALLPRPDGWHGVASAAFGRRVDEVGDRVVAVIWALERADAVLAGAS